MKGPDLAALLAPRVKGVVGSNVALAQYTTYRLGGPAALYLEPADVDDLAALGDVLAGVDEPMPVLALGRGSNLVISDDGWPGAVVKLGAAFSYVARRRQTDPVCAPGGATALPLLANWAARRGLTGMEFAIAIPGSVGGAVRMNAGAHGREIRDCLVTADGLGSRSTALVRASLRASSTSATDARTCTDEQVVLDASFALASCRAGRRQGPDGVVSPAPGRDPTGRGPERRQRVP